MTFTEAALRDALAEVFADFEKVHSLYRTNHALEQFLAALSKPTPVEAGTLREEENG